jgi:dTDP-L-rhamnose 4-epimerase
MQKRVLITGGAGFIGSHLSDELLQHGYRVRILDNLSPQVHGLHAKRPEYLAGEAELMVGDVRDCDAMSRALRNVDSLFHFAAAVRVGQSMYEIAHYTSVNNLGTAVVLEALIDHPVEKFIVASSMSIYGEGLYKDPDGNVSAALERTPEQLSEHQWEVRNNRQQVLTPIPTPETKSPTLASVYALGKFDQERMCLMVGRAYRIPTVALRFFNVYGPRQALSNPYTGVLAIFGSRLLNGRAPLIYEDGLQQRDFVSVHDVARACRLAMENEAVSNRALNIGSGRAVTIREVADRLAPLLGRGDIQPEMTGKCRVGDVRHCFADIRLAQRLLGYQPAVDFDAGLQELAQWLAQRTDSATDLVAEAREQLEARGLAI